MKFLLAIFLLLALYSSAEVPVITIGAQNGSSTLTSPVFYPFSNSVFSYLNTQYKGTNFKGGYYAVNVGSPMAPQGGRPPIKFSFQYTNQEFEVVLCGQSYLQIFDGTNFNYYKDCYNTNASWNPTYIKVSYSAPATRNIICWISSQSGDLFAGINVKGGDSISTNTLGTWKHLLFFGASRVEGYSPNDTWCRWLGGFAMEFERWLLSRGYFIMVTPSGEGGTGYVSNGPSFGETNLVSRFFTDVVSNTPDYVMFTSDAGFNDIGNSVTSSDEYIACTNLFHLGTNALPNTRFSVMGNDWACGPLADYVPATTASTNYSLTIGLAATNTGLAFIDPIGRGFINASTYSRAISQSDSVHWMEFGDKLEVTNIWDFETNVMFGVVLPQILPSISTIGTLKVNTLTIGQ